ncbi:MAG: serine/threonine-protein kinase [Terracidiphilus sp.]|jgi:serine/threonine-protein kinase
MSTPKTIGRYEIIDELGQGAMGSVFRARDPAMNRIVALKTVLAVALASEQGAEYRQRFYREARAAGALAHPGIVAVFDVGEDEGVPFLVMEFVRGHTLDFAMKKGERASLERVCEIGEQIAEALGYAHRNGVVHRDIKPANILLTSREAYGAERPKITDFGVAKLVSQGITTTGQMLGTPAFMSPEQFTGVPIDGRADLFSLGVILYWMATGEQPFPGETMTAVSYKIVHTEPVPPAKLNPAVPLQLESVILKCLAKNPANRYQTGEELAQALAQLRSGGKVASLQATAPLARGTGRASEETLDTNPKSGPNSVPAVEITAMENPPMAAAPEGKRGALLIAAAALLAVIAVGSGYLLPHRHRSAQAPTPAATASRQPVTPQTPALEAVPEAAQAPTGKPSAASAPAPALAPHSSSSSVAFDPKTLDPRHNARLKLELDHFPAGAAFSIEMNRKIYFKGSVSNKADYESLFVPPGVQEFRVTIRGLQRPSNIVSAEFLAGKRMTLRVELRPPAKGSSGTSQTLNPATQIVASLKADRFSF